MAVLTHNEGEAIAALRYLFKRDGVPVPVTEIQRLALRRGVRYDSVNTALRQLIAKGLVEKPKRGFYVPVGKELVSW